MHKPHSSGVRRITHFVRVEIVMEFDFAKDVEKKNLLKSGYGISRSIKFKYIRHIAICEQNMAASRLKNKRSQR